MVILTKIWRSKMKKNECLIFGEHMVKATLAAKELLKDEGVIKYLTLARKTGKFRGEAPMEIILEKGENGLNDVLAELLAIGEGIYI